MPPLCWLHCCSRAVRPVDFAGRLRLRREEQPIELCICITVKDESGEDLRETLTAIGRGLPFLKVRSRFSLPWIM